MAEKRMYTAMFSNGEYFAEKEEWIQRPNHPSGSTLRVSTDKLAEAKLWARPGDARRMGNGACTSWNSLPKGVTCVVIPVDLVLTARPTEVIEQGRRKQP